MDETHNTISGGRFGAVVQARVAHVHAAPTVRDPQRQLRGMVGYFVNRVAELRLLEAASSRPGGPTIVVLTGMGGVGKTASALRWLTDIRDRYAGDHLFIDLRGQDPDASRSPTAVLDRFLRDLDVSPRDIPVDPERLPEHFRSLTAAQPVIVFLDNARTAAQVRPLIPGHPDSLVVVTSRHTLAGLTASHGAIRVPVKPLDEGDAAALLTAMTGHTTSAPELARACGGLPIALRVMGAQVAEQAHASLADAVSALDRRSGDGRSTTDWEVLSVPDDDISVRAVFDASYRPLPEDVRRLYRQLGLHPTPVVDVRAAACAGGLDPAATRRLLDALVRASLLETGPETGRYRMHDLVHAHAADQAAEASAAEREAAVDRIVGGYLERAVEADRVVSSRWRHGPAFADPIYSANPAYPDPGSALDALEADRENLVAAVRLAARTGRHAEAWQLCEALWGLFFMRRHFADWIETYTLGLRAAEQAGDPVAHARMQLHLGFAYFERNAGADDEAEARTGFTEALRRARRIGHARTTSSALESLGLLALRADEPALAARNFADAVDALDGVDHPRGRALLTHHLGRALALSGQDAPAVAQLERARAAFIAIPDPYNEARVLTSLGEAHLRANRPDEAATALSRALPHMRDNRVRHEQARILHLLGSARAGSGAIEAAGEAWLAAAELYEQLGDSRAGEVRAAVSALRSG
ncbi:tetratricopeptide repeat protein [Embleya sp. AB8]|uniref:tetratricopeptide repeat protein n=1 Tax=Embleya sp. AB8 TaxID=3156304 RepID=UPI003C72F165